jgi:hypothetical protein
MLHYTSRRDQIDRLYNGVLHKPGRDNGENKKGWIEEEQSVPIEFTA